MIDPKEAPDGYVAVEAESVLSCTGCAFRHKVSCHTKTTACWAIHRKDRTTVIFKKAHSLVEATLGSHQGRRR